MQSQVKFILKSLIQMVVYWFVGMIILFIIFKLIPGSPYSLIDSGSWSPMQQAIYESEVERLGLDRSGISQFFSFIWNCISGNWGQSLTHGIILDEVGHHDLDLRCPNPPTREG